MKFSYIIEFSSRIFSSSISCYDLTFKPYSCVDYDVTNMNSAITTSTLKTPRVLEMGPEYAISEIDGSDGSVKAQHKDIACYMG